MNNYNEHIEEIIKLYKEGKSLRFIANKFDTYPMTISRVLDKNYIELRHDSLNKGDLKVEEGEKLIEWAKAQKRLVTKDDLAKIIGTKRLSPSYFKKYPELGKYIAPRTQKELKYYSETLYAWLKKNDILFKPNDRKTLGMSIDALLLGEYKDIAIQLNIKPKYISKQHHMLRMQKLYEKAKHTELTIIFITKKQIDDLTKLKSQLDDLKNTKRK